MLFSDTARQRARPNRGVALGASKPHLGFALILAITLMAFIFLLLVTLGTLARTQVQGFEKRKNHFLAQQNARYGLTLAIAQLQKAAGADQRVTATAGVLATTLTENAYWTGVWDTTDPIAAPVWLVSGAAPDPAIYATPIDGNANNTAPDTAALLVGSGSIDPTLDLDANSKSDHAIAVPKVAIPNGTVAWWTGDEGVKASVGFGATRHDQNATWLNTWSPASVFRLQQITGNRFKPELFLSSLKAFTIHPDDPSDSTTRRNLAKLLNQRTLSLMTDFDLDYRLFFHDTTNLAQGVLAHTVAGTGRSLKTDLSVDSSPLGASAVGFGNYVNYSNYMEMPLASAESTTPHIPWEDDLRRRYTIQPGTAGGADNEISHRISPIITEFAMRFSVHRLSSSTDRSNITTLANGGAGSSLSSSDIVSVMYVHIELWNPYTSALVPEPLKVRISGLPDVTLTTQAGEVRNFNLQTLYDNATDADGDPVFEYILPFEELGYSGFDDQSWLPGRIYNWQGPNNFTNGVDKWDGTSDLKGKFYDRSMSNGMFYASSGEIYPSPMTTTHGRFGLSMPEVKLTVELVDANDHVLVRCEDFTFDSVNTATDAYSNNGKGIQFGYDFRMFEPGDTSLGNEFDAGIWLDPTHQDIRHPLPEIMNTGLDLEKQYFRPNGSNPINLTSLAISKPQWLLDRTAGGTGKNFMEDVPLFELPRQPYLSVAELQHLPINNRGSYWIGNSVAGNWNALFDQTFFSGIEFTATQPLVENGEALPNLRLKTINASTSLQNIKTAGGDSAQYFLTQGAFNINSLSVPAWSAILAGIDFKDWQFSNLDGAINGYGENATNLGEVQFSIPTYTDDLLGFHTRFPQSMQETYQLGVPRNVNEPKTEYYRRGTKSLEIDPNGDGDFSDSQSDLLAERVVARIKAVIQAQGRPFFSIEEFLGVQAGFHDPLDISMTPRELSILEKAIADLAEAGSSINLDDAGNVIFYHAPGFLSQADLLHSLGPVLQNRSDTFTIRVYGDTRNPINQSVSAVAYCEARIQRFPDTVNENDNITLPDSLNFPLGRRFRVLSFKWLNQNEI